MRVASCQWCRFLPRCGGVGMTVLQGIVCGEKFRIQLAEDWDYVLGGNFWAAEELG